MVSLRTLIVTSTMLCLLSFGVGAAVFRYWGHRAAPAVDSASLIVEAKRALQERDWVRAAAAVEQIPEADSRRPEALLVLGEVATRRNDWEAALGFYEQIPRNGSDTDVRARLASGEIQFNEGKLQAAHDNFRYGLQYYPDEFFAKSRLSLVLDFCGRRYEASQLLFSLVTQDAFSERHLLLLSDPTAVHEPAKEVKRTKPDPSDPLVNLANGRYALWRDELTPAQEFLEAALQLSPDLAEARVRLGEVHLLKGNEAALWDWHQAAGDRVEWHPGVWLIRARWAESRQDVAGAVRCYWEALRREPNLQLACYRLGRLLPAVAPDVQTEPFIERSVLLQELASLVTVLYNNEHHLPSMQSAAGVSEQLGRYWEAAGWARAALVVDRDLPWAVEMLRRCQPRLNRLRERNDPRLDPAQQVDLSRFPVPPFSSPATGRMDVPVAAASNVIRLSDDSAAVGLEFHYFNGPDPTTESGRMFEFTGGGVAAVDFDLDGWSDLYWVQGCEWPPEAGQSRYWDRLHRNQQTRLQDVTELARLREDRFGQGVTVGDYDQDGFPDLYVANTHQNRLWRNLGDGTFEDVTDAAGLKASQWTTSCLLADLNGDGLPDIVDVNYAHGDDVFTRICESNGIARSCSPLAFPAADDQAYVNLGDGRFAEVTRQAGLEIGEGRGLGIVAFRPTTEQRSLNLFIANDMTANFYFANRTAERGAEPVLEEQGIVSGLAFDLNGSAQACMGIAAADADGNGLLDFCVTNFYAEANNLYLQLPGDSFTDEIVASDMRDASYNVLGFGTQFFDADWDGWPDLIVTNGHVDDFTHQDLPYRMRPQVFQNRGKGKFAEVPSATLGPFFEGEYLGRGLAKLDWNRDRREDIAISHLDSPAVLLTNRTESPHHAIGLTLRGRSVDRDGIGTIVRIRAGEREQVVQLTAGDGYESSNERRLVIGLGAATTASRLEIAWIDGTLDVFQEVAADRDYIAVQGRPLLTSPWP